MIRSFNGKTPKIAKSAFISKSACIIGDVEIGEGCGIWPGTVVRGDFAGIKIGRNTDIEDNCVLHVRSAMEIGDNVVIGHGVVVQAKKIGSNTLIGMNATILDDAEIGENCIIAAGSVVTDGSRIPEGSFVAGVPGVVKKQAPERAKALVDDHFQYYTNEFRKLCKEQGI